MDEIVNVDVPKPEMAEIRARYIRIKERHVYRDADMSRVKSIREGRFSEVSPELFPEAGPFQKPLVANMIDVAARDLAGMLAPLPTFSCTSVNMISEKNKQHAATKTRIAGGYVANSDLQTQMESSADKYLTYGILPGRIELNFESNMPFIRLLDPIGAYPEIDRFGKVVSLFQRIVVTRDEMAFMYPEFLNNIRGVKKNAWNKQSQSNTIEVIMYHDKNWDLAFTTGEDGLLLSSLVNPIGKCMVRVASRPGVTDIPRGQFDDVLSVQLAKARMALLALQMAEDAVNSPLVVPTDVGEVPYGPGATIRTANPAGVGRIKNDIPVVAFQEQSQLDRELKLGSRFPEVRTGNSDASIITGKGIQALMGGYDAQIRVHQGIFARFLQDLVGLCFEVDEVVFGDMKKNLRGSENGNSYEVIYTPKKDIAGDYTVSAKYGLLGGLDPNSFAVYMLQMKEANMFSEDYMRRQMPGDMDVEEERRKIAIEGLEKVALQGIMGLAQSIPAMAQQGQDPSHSIALIAKVISDISKGKSMITSMEDAFPPPPPAPATPSPTDAGMPQPGNAGEQAPATGPAAIGQGMMAAANGTPSTPGGVPAGQDVASLLSKLNAGGKSTMSAGIQRKRPM